MDLQLSSTALKVAEAMAAGKRQYVEQALEYLVAKGGSDLHLSAGSSPLVRLHGGLVAIPGTPELTAEDTQEVLDSFLSDPEKKQEDSNDERGWSRAAISPETSCEAALSGEMAKLAAERGCVAALRATYVDDTGGTAATAAIVAFRDTAAKNDLEGIIQEEQDKADHAVRALPAPGAQWKDSARTGDGGRAVLDVYTPLFVVVTAGPLAGTMLPLRPAGTLIGRSPECALVLDDDYASGRHARIHQADDGSWLVEDLRSTNGTYLGATRLTEPREVVAWMLEDGLRARFQLQLHKLIWDADARGV